MTRKPFFSKINIGSSMTVYLPPCNVVRVSSVSSTVYLQFNDGDQITAVAGDEFKADWPGQFEKVTLTSAAGASATIIYGNGQTLSAGSSVGGGTAGLVGAGSPEGVQTATAGTTYYDTASGGFWVKASGSGNTGWTQLIV